MGLKLNKIIKIIKLAFPLSGQGRIHRILNNRNNSSNRKPNDIALGGKSEENKVIEGRFADGEGGLRPATTTTTPA